MRFLFKDSLLEEYSYKGQKKKSFFNAWSYLYYIWYILLSFIIMVIYIGILTMNFKIIDAVKNMKRYHKYDKIDVEQPMKIFIAGAKFRDKKISE